MLGGLDLPKEENDTDYYQELKEASSYLYKSTREPSQKPLNHSDQRTDSHD